MSAHCALDFCDKPGTLVCSACKDARYCSPAHQKAAWKMHKTECKLTQEHKKKCVAIVSQLQEDSAGKEAIGEAFDGLKSLLSASSRNADRLITNGALEALSRAARPHGGDPPTVEKLLAGLFNICASGSVAGAADDARRARAATSGALAVAIEALMEHVGDPHISSKAIKLLRRMCDGEDEAGVEERCRLASEAGAFEAVVAAIHAGSAPSGEGQAAAEEVGRAEDACGLLCLLAFGALDQAAADERADRAAAAGALEAVVAAMRAYPNKSGLQAQACSCIANICAGADAAATARRHRAVEAGALAAVEAAGDADGRAAMALDVLQAVGDPDGAVAQPSILAELSPMPSFIESQFAVKAEYEAWVVEQRRVGAEDAGGNLV